MNVMIPFTAFTGILTYAWPFARTESSFIAVIVLYGFVFFFLFVRKLCCTHSSCEIIVLQVQLRFIRFADR